MLTNALADAATQPAIGGNLYGVPGWAIGVVATLAGVVFVLRAARKWLIPELGGALQDIKKQVEDLRRDAAVAKAEAQTAKAVANVNSERVSNLAKATLGTLQAAPEPPNAPQLRAEALGHAQAALTAPDPHVTWVPANPPPEKPPSC